MKKLLKSYGEWITLKKQYTVDPTIKKHHQIRLCDTQKMPKKFPCVAVGDIDISLTDYDTIRYTFVTLADFEK